MPAASAAGIGDSTLVCYLQHFCAAVMLGLKDTYMLSKSSTRQLEMVWRAFTLRRGIYDVGLRVDSTNVLWLPDNQASLQ